MITEIKNCTNYSWEGTGADEGTAHEPGEIWGNLKQADEKLPVTTSVIIF